jgi:hypothetical protein
MISEEKVKRYCADFTKIENYDVAISDKNKIWDCHHRLETHNSDGVKRSVFLSKSELKALGVYYNVTSNELVFMTSTDHIRLHRTGLPLSEEVRKNMSASKKGKPSGIKGKHWKLSEETKKRISEGMKGVNKRPLINIQDNYSKFVDWGFKVGEVYNFTTIQKMCNGYYSNSYTFYSGVQCNQQLWKKVARGKFLFLGIKE